MARAKPWRMQFETRGEGLSARGKVSATGFAAPRFAFDVDADQVDADRYFLSAPRRAEAPAKTAAPTASRRRRRMPRSTSAHCATSTQPATFASRSCARTGNDYADLRATVKANGGRLDVTPFSVRVHGGSVSGRVGLDAPQQPGVGGRRR